MAWLLYELLSPFVPHRSPKPRPAPRQPRRIEVPVGTAEWLWQLYLLPAREPMKGAG